MKLYDIYKNQQEAGNMFFSQKRPIISFEIFPPKAENIEQKINALFNELTILKQYDPALISITYGAGGTNVENSLEITRRVKEELKLVPMPHFTCVLKDKTYIRDYLKLIQDMGVENILALRGDIPKDAVNGGMGEFSYANELVEFIKAETNLSIGVAGYPEIHSECDNIEKDIDNLKRKVDAGADVIYTQLFFDNTYFFKFVQLVRDAGIMVPIIPGVLPVSSYAQLEKMIALCGVDVPKSLSERLEKYKDSPEDIKNIGIEFASYQCQQLIDSGVKGIHFYCLNKSEPVKFVLDNIL